MEFGEAHAEGRLEERLGSFATSELLISDELGYPRFETNTAHPFFGDVALLRAQLDADRQRPHRGVDSVGRRAGSGYGDRCTVLPRPQFNRTSTQ